MIKNLFWSKPTFDIRNCVILQIPREYFLLKPMTRQEYRDLIAEHQYNWNARNEFQFRYMAFRIQDDLLTPLSTSYGSEKDMLSALEKANIDSKLVVSMHPRQI